MKDDPFANHKESCEDFQPAEKSKTNASVIHTDSEYFNDDMCRRHARISCHLVKNNECADSLIDRIRQRNSIYNTGNELNVYQTIRQDEIENSIFNMIKVITCNNNLDWNMELIGGIADAVCNTLNKKGYLIYYPNITIDKEGNISISDFYGI